MEMERFIRLCAYNLRSIHLTDCRHVTDNTIVNIGRYCTSLQEFCIEDNGIEPKFKEESFISLFRGCKFLLDVGLYRCTAISERGIQCLVLNCNLLKNLTLMESGNIADEGFLNLLNNSPHLKSFFLKTKYMIKDESILEKLALKLWKVRISINDLNGCSFNISKRRKESLPLITHNKEEPFSSQILFF
jgi:hypothetical protein